MERSTSTGEQAGTHGPLSAAAAERESRESAAERRGRDAGPAGAGVRVQPVILAGGAGTRLWPLSREHYPKQVVTGLYDDGSLLSATANRLDGMDAGWPLAQAPIVVCGEAQRHLVEAQLGAAGVTGQLILEPEGRNTAPALTVAALSVVAAGRDDLLVVMPADHAVALRGAFQAAVDAALGYAQGGALVALGVVPAQPQTGYGYVEVGAAVSSPTGVSGGCRINGFVEKPGLADARRYVASGAYWWNNGIFVMRASTWLAALGRFRPAMLAACRAAFADRTQHGCAVRLDAAAFDASPSDSIDYAVMEHVGQGADDLYGVVVPLRCGWSDLGAWDAVWQASGHDRDGNATRGTVMLEQARATLVHAGSRLVACVGTDGLIVVETPDAVLVADREHAQHVKAIVGRLRAERRSEARQHRKVHRPWGCYDVLDAGERFQVKRIVVEPGGRLSLQKHRHRAEHWVVVRGTARVTRGNDVFLLHENESTFIAAGMVHRLENPGPQRLELVEVQSGAYLGEDDIVRLDDQYGRADPADAAWPAGGAGNDEQPMEKSGPCTTTSC